MEKADVQNGGDPEQSATGSLSAAPKHALRDASSGGWKGRLEEHRDGARRGMEGRRTRAQG